MDNLSTKNPIFARFILNCVFVFLHLKKLFCR